MSIYDEVKNIPLSSIVSQYTSLSQHHNGKFRGCCPIHDGDNPNNFTVDDSTNLWYCFSGECGGGSAIEFLVKMGQADSPWDAAVKLAESHGIDVPHKNTEPPSVQDLLEASDKFCSLVKHTKKLDSYAESRGLTQEMMDQWDIGQLPTSDEIFDQLKDIHPQALEELGYVSTSFGSTRVKDHSRMLFPIVHDGHTVAYSARVIPGVDCQNAKAKYVNASNSSIFTKNNIVFGEQNLSEDTTHVIIVEGQLDAVLLHENLNLPHIAVVAVLGSTLTKGQWDTITKYAPHLESAVLLFDNDEAGIKATMNCVWLLKETEVLVPEMRLNTFLEEKNDPADLLLEGVEALDIVSPCVDYVDDVLPVLCEHKGDDFTQQWLDEHSGHFPSNIVRERFVQNLQSLGMEVKQPEFIPQKKGFTHIQHHMVAPLIRELTSFSPTMRKIIWDSIVDISLLEDLGIKDKDIEFMSEFIQQGSFGFTQEEEKAKFMAEYVWNKGDAIPSVLPIIAKGYSSSVATLISHTPPYAVWSNGFAASMWCAFLGDVE